MYLLLFSSFYLPYKCDLILKVNSNTVITYTRVKFWNCRWAVKQAKKDKEIKMEKEWRGKKNTSWAFLVRKMGVTLGWGCGGFNSICPFFQSVSARLESLTAAEMRAGNGDSWRRQKQHRRTERARGKQDTKQWKEWKIREAGGWPRGEADM